MDEQVGGSIAWDNLTAQELRKEANDPKSKLPSLFERQWVVTMGTPVPCFNCKGLEKSLNLFKQKLKVMAENKCNYQLKGKYNGVYGYNNADLTNKKAQKLIKEHPRGIELFSALPPDLQKIVDDKKEAEQRAYEDGIEKYNENVIADRQVQKESERKAEKYKEEQNNLKLSAQNAKKADERKARDAEKSAKLARIEARKIDEIEERERKKADKAARISKQKAKERKLREKEKAGKAARVKAQKAKGIEAKEKWDALNAAKRTRASAQKESERKAREELIANKPTDESRRKIALSKEQDDLEEKRKTRLVQLLSWDKKRLVKKAKALNITSTGTAEELAKRVHKKEQ